MEVFGWRSNKNQDWTDPFPKENGVYLSFRGGDVIQPWFGNWFKEPYFKYVWHFFVKYPIMPFLSWKFGRFGGYLGCKCFGVDAEAYKHWMPDGWVYSGSRAIMLWSSRLTTKL